MNIDQSLIPPTLMMGQTATSITINNEENHELRLQLEVESPIATQPNTSSALVTEPTMEPTASLPCDLKHFTVFSDLPFELRLHIWRHTMKPSFIEIQHMDSWDFPPEALAAHPLSAICSERESVPIISKICHESRIIFREEYCLYLTSGENNSGLGPIYVNPKIDTVSITFDPDFGSLLSVEWFLLCFSDRLRERMEAAANAELDELTKDERTERAVFIKAKMQQRWGIRKLALNSDLMVNISKDNYKGMKAFSHFPLLEDLLLIIDLRGTQCDDCKGVERHPWITIPETACESKYWEAITSDVGWLKAMDRPNHPAHAQKLPQWMRARVSTAVRRESWNQMPGGGIIDKRGGMELFGPPNRNAHWNKFFKKLERQ